MKRFVSALLVAVTLVSMLWVASFTTSADSTDGLPDVVDLSTSKYFPPIKSQGDQGSCVAWAQGYYQFTYEMNKTLGRESTAENLFSPSFVYNMANYGEDTGCFPSTAFNNMKKIGVATWNTIPYNKEVHGDWFAEESIWQEAAQYRIADFKVLPNFRTGSGKHVEHPDDPDLTQIKTLLSEGKILTFGAYIYRWKLGTIKSNPSCPANEPYVGEEVILSTSPDIGTGYGHRMTLVGYNDNIWVDINKNNTVDKGEMGAFKVANSFGPWWKNDGFIWMAYDNINITTSVEGGLPYKVMSGVVDVTKIEVLPYNSDADIYIRYTLNTKDRQNMTVTVIAEKDGKTTEVVAGPHHDAPYLKNIYSFDGTTNSNDGTMIFMLSNVIPGITSETLGDYKWSIRFEDNKSDSVALTVKNTEIVDLSTNRVIKAQGTFGYKLDGTSQTMNFPQIPQYVPPVTTAPTTAATTTAPDETVETTTAPLISTSPETTAPVYTEPTEITTDIITEVPTEASTTAVVVTTIPEIPTETTTEITTTETKPLITTEVISTTTVPVDVTEHIYGDTNNSNSITITDATLIQKFVAYIIGEDKLNLKNADCNLDAKVNVKDATNIQKYLAKLDGCGVVGEKYTESVPVTDVTEPTEVSTATAPSTEAVTTETTTSTAVVTDPEEPTNTTESVVVTEPTEVFTEPTTATSEATEIITTTTAVITEPKTEAPTETPTEIVTEPATTEPATEAKKENIVTFTNSFGWQGTISCYYWSDNNMTMSTWPGVAMENAGTNTFGETLYTIKLPEDAEYIIFTNGSVQTVDIPYSGGEQKFYPVSADSSGKYTVNNW